MVTARRQSAHMLEFADLLANLPLSSRIEGFVVAHVYPCIGILTHDLPALRRAAVEYFPSF